MKKLPMLLCSLLLMITSLAIAQPPIVFILDASGSMWGKIGQDVKIEIASDVLATTISNLPEAQKTGLVAYGHRQKGDCEDVEFLMSMDNMDKAALINKMNTIKPLGKTPLAYSATLVINQLRTSKNSATVILVTDGIESCDGDLCEVVKNARAEGIDFRMHIVGFGLKEGETRALKCAAEAGGGQYYDAQDATGLSDVLNEATQSTVDKPPFNYTLYALKNGKPVDAYVKAILISSGKTIASARTYGDTAQMYLPPGKYDLSTHPLENSDIGHLVIPGINSVEGKTGHQTISFDGGTINIKTTNNQEGWDAVVRIYPKGSNKSVASGRTYAKIDSYEVNPGIYDIELKAMTIEGTGSAHRINNVEVKGNTAQELSHNFESGIVMIGVNSSSGLVDAVVKIKDLTIDKHIASSRTYQSAGSNPRKFVLSPGSYEVQLKALGDHKGKVKTIKIRVEAGTEIEKIVELE